MPKPGSKNADVYGLVTDAICTQTNHHILRDGFKSWPSGHSSGMAPRYLAKMGPEADSTSFIRGPWIPLFLPGW